MDKEKLRSVAVKLHGFKVIEGLGSCTIEIPWEDIPVIDSYGKDTGKSNQGVVEINISEANHLRIIHRRKGRHNPTTNRKVIYDGPILWLKGVVDYDPPEEDRDWA